jgi:hypothetical protein
VSRFWRTPLPIAVTSDALATPASFICRGSTHHVVAVLERWRDDERWLFTHIWQENFIVRTRGGLQVLIFQDLLTREWYLQRIYD